MTTTELGEVRYEHEPPIARIVLDNPKQANAQSSAMVAQVDQCLDLARHDYDIKVVILKANGKGFCAGHVIKPNAYPEFAEATRRQGKNWQGSKRLFVEPTLRLWEFPKPMIAQVHGYALGGGTYWALLPDLTIAAEDAYFQMPLVQALGFPGGETMIEPWIFMNYKRAAEYLYTAQTLSAQDALNMGLVNRVIPRADLESEVERTAAHIAKAPLSTLMATKSLLLRAWEGMGMRQHIVQAADAMALLEDMTDAREHRQRLLAGGQLPRKAIAPPEHEVR